MAVMQVVSAIDACSAANTEASLKASIAQGVTNKDLSDQAIFSTIQTHSSKTTAYGDLTGQFP